MDKFRVDVARRHPWLPAPLCRRLCDTYGTRVSQVIGDAAALADLGEEPVPGLHVREIDYLITHEWARKAEDILWRRTRLGLHLPGDAQARLQAWLARERPIMK